MWARRGSTMLSCPRVRSGSTPPHVKCGRSAVLLASPPAISPLSPSAIATTTSSPPCPPLFFNGKVLISGGGPAVMAPPPRARQYHRVHAAAGLECAYVHGTVTARRRRYRYGRNECEALPLPFAHPRATSFTRLNNKNGALGVLSRLAPQLWTHPNASSPIYPLCRMAGTGPSTPPAGGSSSSSSSGGGRKGGGKRREDEVAPSSSQKRQKKAKPNSQRPRWEGSAGLFDLPGDEDPMAMPHPPSNPQ